MYLIPKVQVDDIESLRGGIKKLSQKKRWANKYVRNNKVEITILMENAIGVRTFAFTLT